MTFDPNTYQVAQSAQQDPNKAVRSLSQLLQDVKSRVNGEHITLGEILETFHERGFGFFLFLFALPAAIPLPGLGINVVIALPLLLLTFQQMVGRHTIWLPERVKQRSLTSAFVNKMVESALPWTARLELLVKPRLGFVTQGALSIVIGALGFIMSLSILLPVPLTNTVPAMGIALMSVGVLMRDGLAVLAGAILGTAWVTMLTGIVVIFGPQGIDLFKEAIKSLF